MKKFEELYRIRESDDVLMKEDAIHSDLDRRLDAVEIIADEFRLGNRADIQAILHSLETTFGVLAAEMRALLDTADAGLSADTIKETANRVFLTAARRQTILDDANAALASAVAAIVNGSPRTTLKALSDSIDVNASSLAALIAGASPGAATFAAVYTRLAADEMLIANLATNRLIIDGSSQTISAANAAQVRYNLGKSAPLRISSSITLDQILGVDRTYEFMGAYTATAPSTGLFDGWRTGVFHNRGNGSIATANFVGTIAVAAGAYLNGVLNGKQYVAYGQKGFLEWDANASPNPTWRWVYTDESPIVFKKTVADFGAGGLASIDFAVPSGYSAFDLVINNYSCTADSALGYRLSADGGATIIASNYTYELAGRSTGITSGVFTQTYMTLIDGNSQSYTNNPAYFGQVRATIESKYGGNVLINSCANGTADLVFVAKGYQAGNGSPANITPNLYRFLCASGTFKANITIRAIP